MTHPGQILGISGAYWRSSVLHAAVNLDLFTLVGDESLTAPQISSRVGAHERGTATLLNSVVALGLMQKKDGKFSNTPLSLQYLSSESPSYVGPMIKHHSHLARAWVKLDEAVKTGEPVQRSSSGSSGAIQDAFLRGMHVLAMGIAPQLVPTIDLEGRNTLLDLGGGPGTWAIQFALANPGLQATIFDLPGSRPFAEKTIGQFNASDQVVFHGGDFTVHDLPGKFDVAWLSHILHGEDPLTCRSLVAKAVDALNDRGLIFIHEFILDDDGASPAFPAIFSLNMLLVTRGGRSYRQLELQDMLAQAGVTKTRILDFVGPTQSRILVGEK
ncbi:MAG: methyltransferase domain-containing protein [Proteobacteria bacterium]|nr:methyltransferase domain-containing protein [Pseudomonadota bacterium]